MQLIDDRKISQGLRSQGASQAASPPSPLQQKHRLRVPWPGAHTRENVKKSSLGKGRLRHSTEEKTKKNRSLLAVGVG